MVQAMAELRTLRAQVPLVLGVRRNFERQLLGDGQAEALDAGHLARIVREDADRAQPEVGEDLVADSPLARVWREAELEVRFDRVEPFLLELVRLQLVQKAD